MGSLGAVVVGGTAIFFWTLTCFLGLGDKPRRLREDNSSTIVIINQGNDED